MAAVLVSLVIAQSLLLISLLFIKNTTVLLQAALPPTPLCITLPCTIYPTTPPAWNWPTVGQILHVPFLRIHHHYVTYCCPCVRCERRTVTCQESNTKSLCHFNTEEKKAEIIPFPGPIPNPNPDCKHKALNHLTTSHCWRLRYTTPPLTRQPSL